MISKLKNWWLVILAGIGFALEIGFDAINPVLLAIGIGAKWVDIIKALFVFGAIIKAKKALPTQNPEKLQTLVDEQSIGTPRVPKAK